RVVRVQQRQVRRVLHDQGREEGACGVGVSRRRRSCMQVAVRRACLAEALLLATALATGCKSPPKVGDRCHLDDKDKMLGCEGPTSALVCEGIRLQSTPCRGPKGCTRDHQAVSCDRTLGQAGDGCDPTDKTERCSTDASTLVCDSTGKLVVA